MRRPDMNTGQQKPVHIVVFSLINEEMGLDISCVREVLKLQEIHPLPQAPDFVEGVINLRGKIIAVIDLKKKFHNISIEDRENMRIMICKIDRFIVGLLVDGVSEVINVAAEDVQPPPEVIAMGDISSDYVQGIARVGERIITILDLEKVLTKDDITKMTDIKK